MIHTKCLDFLGHCKYWKTAVAVFNLSFPTSENSNSYLWLWAQESVLLKLPAALISKFENLLPPAFLPPCNRTVFKCLYPFSSFSFDSPKTAKFLNRMWDSVHVLHQELLLNSLSKSLWKFLQAPPPPFLTPWSLSGIEDPSCGCQPSLLPHLEAKIRAPWSQPSRSSSACFQPYLCPQKFLCTTPPPPRLFFWLHRVACGILIPQPGIELVLSAVEAWRLNHWTTREVLVHFVGENEYRILLRIVEQLAIPFSRESSQLRDQIRVSCIAGGLFTIWATRETHLTTAEFFELYQIISGLFFVKKNKKTKNLLIPFLQSSDCCWCLDSGLVVLSPCLIWYYLGNF